MESLTVGKNVDKREIQGSPVAEPWHARPEPGPDPCSHDALPNRKNINMADNKPPSERHALPFLRDIYSTIQSS